MPKRVLEPNTTLYPVPIVLITTGGDTPNVMTCNRIASCSAEPPRLSISVRPGRFSHDLIQQSGDCDSLMSSLQALQMAQMAIGSCQNWGQCQGPPRAGPGGKGGRGVGTWAEEYGWQFEPQITDLWDNSGVERPDLDPRGISDRGDAKAPDLGRSEQSPNRCQHQVFGDGLNRRRGVFAPFLAA